MFTSCLIKRFIYVQFDDFATGCEYGDRANDCLAAECPNYTSNTRDVICCKTCATTTTTEPTTTTTEATTTTTEPTTTTTEPTTTTTETTSIESTATRAITTVTDATTTNDTTENTTDDILLTSKSI